MSHFFHWYFYSRRFVNWIVIVGSVLLCLLVSPMRLPGMELLGIAPNWLLIWVVVWSIKRTAVQGAIAGLVLGLLQDGMTSPYPTHALSLVVVGILTARLHKQRYIQEDFICVALIVFGLAALVETITALQLSFLLYFEKGAYGDLVSNLADIWTYHQQVALCSAILSSLWAPVIYYPLNLWWETIKEGVGDRV